jgi:hypothetical protein
MKKHVRSPLPIVSSVNRKVAHPDTYLIANLLLLFALWVAFMRLLWSARARPIWWGWRIVLSALMLVVLAYIEHRYLTIIVGWLVEQLFPDEAATARYRQSEERNASHA